MLPGHIEVATKCPFLALSWEFSPPNLAVEMLFRAVIPPGLTRWQGMILGLACGEIWSLALAWNQLQSQGKSLAPAAKPPVLVGKAGPEHGWALCAGEQICPGRSLWEYLGSF